MQSPVMALAQSLSTAGRRVGVVAGCLTALLVATAGAEEPVESGVAETDSPRSTLGAC